VTTTSRGGHASAAMPVATIIGFVARRVLRKVVRKQAMTLVRKGWRHHRERRKVTKRQTRKARKIRAKHRKQGYLHPPPRPVQIPEARRGAPAFNPAATHVSENSTRGIPLQRTVGLRSTRSHAKTPARKATRARGQVQTQVVSEGQDILEQRQKQEEWEERKERYEAWERHQRQAQLMDFPAHGHRGARVELPQTAPPAQKDYSELRAIAVEGVVRTVRDLKPEIREFVMETGKSLIKQARRTR
jgi:hypothetical protein